MMAVKVVLVIVAENVNKKQRTSSRRPLFTLP